MLLYGPTLFLSALLLFQVQPLLGKRIVPWFGGSPAVWAACLAFFQVVLLAGYAYAHGLASRLAPRFQAVVHVLVLAGSLAFLPVLPGESWAPTSDLDPALQVVLLLALSAAGPLFVLSSTVPLLSTWFERRHAGRSPYRLYALSNAGSLLGLASYPVLLEPRLDLLDQSRLWTAAYAAFVLGALACAAGVLFRGGTAPGGDARIPSGSSPARVALWVALSAISCALLVATTNQLCHDVAAVPLLWILPLAVFLVSYIVVFARREAPPRRMVGALLAAGALTGLVLLQMPVPLSLPLQIAGYLATLFVLCWALHAELLRSRPEPSGLTAFYLSMSTGGALGGVAVGLGAPWFFDGYWEYPLALFLATALVGVLGAREVYAPGRRPAGWRLAVFGHAPVLGIGILGAALLVHSGGESLRAVRQTRGFFGVLRVLQRGATDDPMAHRALLHGGIEHGMQFLSEDRRDRPTAYYGPNSGVGLAILRHPRRELGPLRIAVVGLGVGTIAAYARPGDHLAFYEIDPEVVALAQDETYFTYLSDARARGAEVEIFVGDARVVLERQAREGGVRPYDLLVVDAFSGDAIPVHLLTVECAERAYRPLLSAGAIAAFHVTNRYLDLRPVVRDLVATGLEREALLVPRGGDLEHGIYASTWVLATDDAGFARDLAKSGLVSPWPSGLPRVRWTDGWSNLWEILATPPD